MPDVRVVNPAQQLADMPLGHGLVLRFKPSVKSGLRMLNDFVANGQVTVSEGTQKLLAAARQSGDWTVEPERAVIVRPTERFKIEAFLGGVYPTLASLHIRPKGQSQPPRSILTGRTTRHRRQRQIVAKKPRR